LSARAVSELELALAEHERLGAEPPAPLLNNLAWLLCEADGPGAAAQRERAVHMALRARERAGPAMASSSIHDTYAWALFRSGRPLEAEAEYRKLLLEAPSAMYHYHLAEVLLTLERVDEALSHVDEALSAPGSFAEDEAARDLRLRIQRLRRQDEEQKLESLPQAGTQPKVNR
jgi:tetratricopeptide (TPR) repeat protein